MRLYNLFESSYQDIYPKALTTFINSNKELYNNNIFIHFTNNRDIAFSNNMESISALGMECYPLTFFIRNPVLFSKVVSKNRYFRVIRPAGKMLKINAITKSRMVSHMKQLGISDPASLYNDVITKFNYKKKEYSYGFALYYAMSHSTNGDAYVRLSPSATVENLSKLGYDGMYDTSKIITYSILSDKYASVCYFIKKGFKTVESVDTHNTTRHINNDFDDDHVIKKLGSFIAKALGSELNSDDMFREGMNSYLWTREGIQIRINTGSFGVSKNTSSTDTRYVIDIETPYGILYYTSTPEESFENIASAIEKQYSGMNNIIPDWKPRNVDIFLSSYEAEYKNLEQRQDDIIAEIGKYYPQMKSFGERYNIRIPELSFYSNMDRVFIDGIMERFRSNPSARTFIEKISKEEEITDITVLKKYFPRDRLPKEISFNTLKKMAIIYDMAKKIKPNKSGWQLFTTK